MGTNKATVTVFMSPQFLIHCIHVAIAVMFPKDYTAEVHVCFDKFLCAVALALSEKYR